MRYRTATSLLIVLAFMLASFVAACGDSTDGQTPGGPTVLTPSGSVVPSGSTSPNGSTSPTPSGSPSGTTGGSPSPTATNGGGQGSVDQAIKDEILKRFAASPALNGLRITVKVKNREVSLLGTVHAKIQKTTAEQLAVTVPHVKRVLSYIVVKSGSQY
jgi:hypothetical protein